VIELLTALEWVTGWLLTGKRYLKSGSGRAFCEAALRSVRGCARLEDRGAADRLGEMTLAGAWRAEEPDAHLRSGAAVDPAKGIANEAMNGEARTPGALAGNPSIRAATRPESLAKRPRRAS
jgi:hypothetical protein